eukprot:COSAG02_NODE_3978_length_5960_cov_5.861116_2_plen_75_part_00
MASERSCQGESGWRALEAGRRAEVNGRGAGGPERGRGRSWGGQGERERGAKKNPVENAAGCLVPAGALCNAILR